MKTAEKIAHVFESAGLGSAPFSFVGVETRRGPIKMMQLAFDGKTMIEVDVGAPGQPMGTCDYCGTGIADCYMIRSADGKNSIVGCECVSKTGDRGLKIAIERAKKELNREKNDAKKAANIKALESLLADESIQSSLLTFPHPSEKMAARGFSRLDWAHFMLDQAGDAGRRTAIKFIKSIDRA